MTIPDRCLTYLKNLRFPKIPVRRYFHSERVETPLPGWGRIEWVLARHFYRFKRFDLTNVPRASRNAALDLHLQQWMPYGQGGHFIHWSNGFANVFCWDAERVEQAIAEQNLNPARVRVIPETLLRADAAEGARLVSNLHGCEGQIWAANQLLHSRWWKEAPTPEGWLLFQRDAGLPPEAQTLSVTPQSLPFMDAPWAAQTGMLGLLGGDWRNEKLLYLALALALPAPTAWYAAQISHYRSANARLQAEYAALQQQTSPLADARGQALQATARIQQLRAVYPYPHQLELMAWIAEHIIREGDRLAEWDFQDGKLKFTLAMSGEPQSSELVNALQLSGLFDNVRASPGKTPKSIVLEMDVLELH